VAALLVGYQSKSKVKGKKKKKQRGDSPQLACVSGYNLEWLFPFLLGRESWNV
jgi:hypothetical protein